MNNYYSLPNSLTATLKSERVKYPVITDVDFGRTRTFKGREKKAKAQGYRKAIVAVDMGDELINASVFYKRDERGKEM